MVESRGIRCVADSELRECGSSNMFNLVMFVCLALIYEFCLVYNSGIRIIRMIPIGASRAVFAEASIL